MPGADDSKTTQLAFRILLEVMAHPGEIHALPTTGPEQGLPLLAQTLLDHEVGFAVIGPDCDLLASTLEDLTRSRRTEACAADFIFVTHGSSGGGILEANRGTLDYPDRGATVIYLVEWLGAEEPTRRGGVRIRLEGPGIREDTGLRITGLEKDEMINLKKVNQEFPLGVDCFLLDRGDRIVGIPRSNAVEVL
jgi:alpha-D-ribose 1-methylphosphonate 5-triphosphate synthase subunit PhnH